MEKAPVVIFTFNRPDNLKSLLVSLSLCKHASETKVYLHIDGPRNDKDKVSQLLFDDIITPFEKLFFALIVVKKKSNIGLRNSLIEGITDTLSNYGSAIVLEDDLILSPNFLTYMNTSLQRYKENKNVGSISGYSNSISSKFNKDNYFHLRPCSWGWATWEDRWEIVDWNYKPDSVVEWISLWLKCKPVGDDIFRMFRDLHTGKINSWAISWTIHNIVKGKYTSYPFISKVKNDGFGELATHCKSDNPFITNFVKTNEHTFQLLDDIKIDKKVIFKFNIYFSNIYKLFFKLGFRLKRDKR
jgi:hypothetical protein